MTGYTSNLLKVVLKLFIFIATLFVRVKMDFRQHYKEKVKT